MNPTDIFDALEAIAKASFDPAEFGFSFAEATDNARATVSKLRGGSVIGVGEAGFRLPRPEGFVVLALDPDEVRDGDDDGVQPWMPTAGPWEPHLGFGFHQSRGPVGVQAGQVRKGRRRIEEPAERVDGQGRRVFGACDFATLDFVAGRRVEGLQDFLFGQAGWRRTGDAAILDEIRAYNEVDCVSTEELRDWLVSIRPEGPWPVLADEGAGEKEAEADERTAALRAQLAASELPDDRQRLLFDLAQYHWRDDKPVYWSIHDSIAKEEDDLVESVDALGGLIRTGAAVRTKQSIGQRFTFPQQETRLKEGDRAVRASPAPPDQ